MVGKERARVSVGSTAEEDEIEEGQFDGVALGEDGNESLLVLIGAFLRIVETLLVNGEDFGPAQCLGDVVEEIFLHESVVGVFVVERDDAFVGVENFPLGKVGSVFGSAIGRREEGFGESFGERTSGDGYAKGSVVTAEGFVLGFEDVLSQVRSQVLVDVGEGVETRWATHGVGGDDVGKRKVSGRRASRVGSEEEEEDEEEDEVVVVVVR